MGNPKIGKIDLDTFTSFILKRLGKKDDTVIVPPRTGVDSAVIDIGNSKVLIVAEDPIFAFPKQPWRCSAGTPTHRGKRRRCYGCQARYMTYSILMPPQR
jgi:hydrogenase expression/formation protein HypE